MKSRLLTLAMLVLALLAASCSKTKDSLLEGVPHDMDYVVIGDLQSIIKSAGGSIDGSQITVPNFIAKELGSDDEDKIERLNEELQRNGVNPKKIVIVGKYKYKTPVVVFALNDANAFEKSSIEEGFAETKKEKGATFYSKKVQTDGMDSDWDFYDHFAVRGNIVYYVNSVRQGDIFKPQKFIADMIEDSDDKSFAETPFYEYISEGNAGGVALRIGGDFGDDYEKVEKKKKKNDDFADFYKGVLCMKGNLDGDEATVDMKFFDNDGKDKDLSKIAECIDLSAKVDADALQYLNENEFLVCALSLKDVDWDKYLDSMVDACRLFSINPITFGIIKGYLEKIDGTVAVGWGVENGVSTINDFKRKNDLNGFSFTMVCQTKEGKADEIMSELTTFYNMSGMPYRESDGGVELLLPASEKKLHVKAIGNTLVLSTNPVKKRQNPVVKAVDFASSISSFAIVLPKSHQLMSELGLDNDFSLVCQSKGETSEGKLTLKVSGTDNVGVVGRLAKIFFAINAKNKELRAAQEKEYSEELILEIPEKIE